ncbi:hypothetical protein GOP47_0018420 [Adiantum capillus-veneris]|uniref:Uncharacterized protein n=1 Tax=Adiantum capillus-veneris TaxID=13818 RepID=A0A9D4UD62_ADICA|nr:hypothetical protein GOP47_0018420 [Adiantum capillus-veneris]
MKRTPYASSLPTSTGNPALAIMATSCLLLSLSWTYFLHLHVGLLEQRALASLDAGSWWRRLLLMKCDNCTAEASSPASVQDSSQRQLGPSNPFLEYGASFAI